MDDLVYFLYSGGLLKIGYTGGLPRRLAELTNMGAASITLVALIPGDKSMEKYLHQIFKADRRHGEWFHPSAEIKRFLSCIDDAATVLVPPETRSKLGSCVERLEAAINNDRQ